MLFIFAFKAFLTQIFFCILLADQKVSVVSPKFEEERYTAARRAWFQGAEGQDQQLGFDQLLQLHHQKQAATGCCQIPAEEPKAHCQAHAWRV